MAAVVSRGPSVLTLSHPAWLHGAHCLGSRRASVFHACCQTHFVRECSRYSVWIFSSGLRTSRAQNLFLHCARNCLKLGVRLITSYRHLVWTALRNVGNFNRRNDVTFRKVWLYIRKSDVTVHVVLTEQFSFLSLLRCVTDVTVLLLCASCWPSLLCTVLTLWCAIFSLWKVEHLLVSQRSK